MQIHRFACLHTHTSEVLVRMCTAFLQIGTRVAHKYTHHTVSVYTNWTTNPVQSFTVKCFIDYAIYIGFLLDQ